MTIEQKTVCGSPLCIALFNESIIQHQCPDRLIQLASIKTSRTDIALNDFVIEAYSLRLNKASFLSFSMKMVPR